MWVLFLIALVVLLYLGGDRLAALGKGLGEGAKAFKKTVRNAEREPPRSVTVVSMESKLLSDKDEASTPTAPPDDTDDPHEGT